MKLSPGVFSHQRSIYHHDHQDRLNLFIHMLTAPLFVLALLSFFAGLAIRSPTLALLSVGALIFAVVLEGFGHSREVHRKESFLSSVDFLFRFFTENTVTFWRFLFSGDFMRNWKKSDYSGRNK